jgi:chorismate binding enzyme
VAESWSSATIFSSSRGSWLQAGAGIVRQSRPEREHEETCERLRDVARNLVPEQAAVPGQAVPEHAVPEPVELAEPDNGRNACVG